MTATTTSTVEALQAEVVELRAELDTLRRELQTEVRTRRLVVVDEHGAERIFSTVYEHVSQWAVVYGNERDRGAEAVMQADAECVEPMATIYAAAGGQMVATMNAALDAAGTGAGRKVEAEGGLRIERSRPYWADEDLSDAGRRFMAVRPTSINAGRAAGEIEARARFDYSPTDT